MKRIALLLLVLFALVQAAPAGERIKVVMSTHPFARAMQEMIPEFTKETGIEVDFEMYSDDQLTQKLTVEFTSGSSSIDVFSMRPPNEGAMLARNGYLEDLELWYGKDADYDINDFTPSSLAQTNFGGKQVAIPYNFENEVVFYRKDIFEAKGLKPPTTMEELEKCAELLTDRANEMYGFVSRGQANALISQFASFVYCFGSDWTDKENKKSLVNTPEFIEAIGFYGNMLRKYGPPGVLNMGWPQALAIFMQGKAAIYTDGSGTFPNLLDTTRSAVADKTGIAVFPRGPGGRHIYDVVPLALSIYSGSPKKEAAWKFLRWNTDKKRMAIQQGKYANLTPRRSLFSNPEAQGKFPADLLQAFADSVDGAITYNLPRVTAVTEARDVIGEAVVAAIEGKDYKAAAQVAHERFQAILDREAAEK